MILYASPNVKDNGDGTISQDINALVRDMYGNPVEYGTAVYFELWDGDDSGSLAQPPTYGVICGSAFSGDPLLNTSCELETGAEIKGVAHSLLTWVPEGIFKYYRVSAETTTGSSVIFDTLAGPYPGLQAENEANPKARP